MHLWHSQEVERVQKGAEELLALEIVPPLPFRLPEPSHTAGSFPQRAKARWSHPFVQNARTIRALTAQTKSTRFMAGAFINLIQQQQHQLQKQLLRSF